MTTLDEDGPLTTIFVDDKATKRRLKKSRLVVLEGPDRGKELVVEKEKVTGGRSVICDLSFTDKSVSGSHFEIVASERGVLLRDLHSTNGLHIGELKVQEVWLAPGTVFRAGQSTVRYEPVKGLVEIDLSKDERFHELLGRSVKMREIFAQLEKVAASELTVLIRGDTGTGKELVARAIHRHSKRAEQPLVVQDCGAIPKDLVESTLFGHERGAFTGATDRYRGSFEQADSGTIFLDELGELDLALQPKLLRVIENREIKRVGGDRTLPVNVRVIAATNRDLRQMVNEGTFREDLFYRLGVVQIELPALKERPEDVPLLVESFLEEFSARRWPGEGKRFVVSKDAMARLQSYPWPGNVRELRNTLERAASLSDGEELTMKDLLPASQKTPAYVLPGGVSAEQFVSDDLPFKEAKQRVVDSFEAAYLKALLDKFGGNVTRSAQAAGLTRYHLRELAKRYGIRGGQD